MLIYLVLCTDLPSHIYTSLLGVEFPLILQKVYPCVAFLLNI